MFLVSVLSKSTFNLNSCGKWGLVGPCSEAKSSAGFDYSPNGVIMGRFPIEIGEERRMIHVVVFMVLSVINFIY